MALSEPEAATGGLDIDDLLYRILNGGTPGCSPVGDYVDRGHQSLECILLFFSYKVKYPANVFLLRRNHECPAINRAYGFFDECKRRYPNSKDLWNTFQILKCDTVR